MKKRHYQEMQDKINAMGNAEISSTNEISRRDNIYQQTLKTLQNKQSG